MQNKSSLLFKMKDLFQAALAAGFVGLSGALPSFSHSSPPTGDSYASGFEMTKSWGNLSPYKDSDEFGLPKGVPVGCELSQVHVLHRHAQRYPTDNPLDGGGMVKFKEKIGNYTKDHPHTKIGKGPLEFLNQWTYALGTDELMATGAATEATSGGSFWSKYGRLLYRAPPSTVGWDESLNKFPNGTMRPKPVFRTTSQARILESARWWLG